MRIRTALLALLIVGLAPIAEAEPTVVELFQSQGCSSCPPADANLNAIADRPDVLALSFAVTYWDNLGWKDTFANPVINGRHDVDGIDSHELAAAVHAAGAPAGASLAVAKGSVSIAAGSAPARGADVWLVRYDPRVQLVAIRRGENGGKTLPHRDIVRQFTRLGGWFGAARNFPLSGGAAPGLKTAILVQTTGGGPILAAAKL
jgi:hypothetical protein